MVEDAYGVASDGVTTAYNTIRETGGNIAAFTGSAASGAWSNFQQSMTWLGSEAYYLAQQAVKGLEATGEWIKDHPELVVSVAALAVCVGTANPLVCTYGARAVLAATTIQNGADLANGNKSVGRAFLDQAFAVGGYGLFRGAAALVGNKATVSSFEAAIKSQLPLNGRRALSGVFALAGTMLNFAIAKSNDNL